MFLFVILLDSEFGQVYKFRDGAPLNWDKLCVIFDGATTTRKLRYARTQSPPSFAHSDWHVNIPPTIVDLVEPHPCPQQVSRSKGKAKRYPSPMESSRSSKRSTTSASVFELVTERLSFLHNSYEKKCNVNEFGHSHASAPAPAPVPEAPHAQSPSEEAMDRINTFVPNEMQMPVNSYLRACEKVNDENWAKIVVKMNELAFKRWLVKLILPEDT